MPRVSILIPNRNYARFLAEALESILAQDFGDFEVIVSDDQSTDDSVAVAERFVARDPRIRCHAHAKNLGQAGNANWCLAQARGEFIKFLYSDDRLSRRDSLRRWVDLLDQHPHAVIASSARRVIDNQSRPIDLHNTLAAGVHDGHALARLSVIEFANPIGEPSAVLLRRSALRRGFDTTLLQIVDLNLWLDLLSRGDLVHVRTALCDFRQHNAQQTALSGTTQLGLREHARLCKAWIPEMLKEKPLSLSEQWILAGTLHLLRTRENVPDEVRAIIPELKQLLGPGFLATYWPLRRLTRPFSNTWRSIGRKWRRRQASREDTV